MTLAPGTLIENRYEVRSVTEGATGVLYMCHDRDADHACALRTLQERFFRLPLLRESFVDDVARWLTLGWHPNTMVVQSIEIITRQPYVVSDYVKGPDWIDGPSLRSWIGTSHLSVERIVDLALQISAGMTRAGSVIPGFVHGDLRPEKVLVSDAGIAALAVPGGSKVRALRAVARQEKLAEGDVATLHAFLTSGSARGGVLPYLAPEVWLAGDRVPGAAADVYAFGCILHELITGTPPVTFDDLAAWVRYHDTRGAVQTTLPADLPPEVREVVARCLQRDAGARYQSFAPVESLLNAVYERVAQRPHAVTKLWRDAMAGTQVSDTQQLAELTARARGLEQLGRFTEAVDVLERALAIDPDDLAALTRLANVLVWCGDIDRSAAVARKATEHYPDSTRGWLTLGYAHMKRLRYADALVAFDRASQIPDPTDKERVWLNKGSCLLMLGREEEALDSFEQALAIQPTYVKALTQKAAVLGGLGRVGEALATANRVLELDPTSWQAWSYKIHFLEQMGRQADARACREQLIGLADAILDAETDPRNAIDFASAVMFDASAALKAFDRALALAPNLPEALLHKGVCLRRLGRIEQSLACYDLLVSVAPDDDTGWLNRGNVLADADRIEDAITSYRRALAVNPRNALAAQNLGNQYRVQGHFEEAVDWYRKAVAEDPARTVAWRMMADSLARLGRRQEAMTAVNQGLDANPANADLWLVQSRLYRQLFNDIDAAIRSCDRAIEVSPRRANAWIDRSEALWSGGRLDEAIESLDRALALDPKSIDAWRCKSALLITREQPREAIACCNAGLRHDPTAGELWNNKGVALLHLQESDEALGCFAEAVRTTPELSMAWRNLGDLLLSAGSMDEAQRCFRQADALEARG